MDMLSHHRGSKRDRKQKKEGLKVVYISNPMKINATASSFRALVQELTGQDSDASRLLLSPDELCCNSPSASAQTLTAAANGEKTQVVYQPARVAEPVFEQFESEGVFMSQIEESLAAISSSSGFFYDETGMHV